MSRYHKGYEEDPEEQGEPCKYLKQKLKEGVDKINKTLPKNNQIKINIARMSRVTPDLNFTDYDMIYLEVFGDLLNKNGKVEKYYDCLEIEGTFYEDDELTSKLKKELDTKVESFLKQIKEYSKELDKYVVDKSKKQVEILEYKIKHLQKKKQKLNKVIKERSR